LISLKNEVDQRLDKVNIRTIHKKNRRIMKIRKAARNCIKVKERELKNTFQMMQIVKRIRAFKSNEKTF
jgi:hypothetical protein